jgi:hypothetical protein
MTERAARGEPFLSGMLTRGEVVYVYAEGEAASHREPIAIFTGEVPPQYASDLDDRNVRAPSNKTKYISPTNGPGR